jgi:signal transduction histidine kinase
MNDELLFKVDKDKIFPFSSGNALILVRHSSGTILSQEGHFGDLNFPYKEEIRKVNEGADSSYITLEDFKDLPEAEADSYRMITFPLSDIGPSSFYLQIAVPMTTFEVQLDRFNRIIKYGFPALLLMAVLLGLYFSSRALRPVQELIQNTNKIGISNLSDRVPLPQSRDEIRTLAETQNNMLDRIQKSFQSQEKFIADASHQLLTPLTILRGEIEFKIKESTLYEKTFLKSFLQETDNLSKIVKDMLLLARIDAGNEVANFKNVDVSEILFDVIARVQKSCIEKGIQIKVEINQLSEQKNIRGEPDLLFNLFYNILENAIKYSKEKQNINVVITWDKQHSLVDIMDQGIGIPAVNASVIFDRFSRVNTSSSTKGFGLGLAIAKKIADLHGFELTLVPDREIGAHFRIKMH